MEDDARTTTDEDWSLAKLVVLSTTDTADELVAAIGMPADEAWNRGEPTKTRGLIQKFSGVRYISRLPRTVRPELHLADLLARLEPVGPRIADLATRLAEQDRRPDPVRIRVTHLTSNASPGYDFSPAQMALVGEMGAWLGVSVDVYDPDEAEAEPAPDGEAAETPVLVGVGGAAERSAGEAG